MRGGKYPYRAPGKCPYRGGRKVLDIHTKTGKYIPPADHPWRRSNKIIHREWAQGIF